MDFIKYYNAFEFALDPIIWADSSGTIINCNKAAEKFFERRKDELINNSINILHPDEEIKDEGGIFYSGFQNKKAVSVETTIITKSLKIIPVHIKANIIKTKDGYIAQGIIRDLTELKTVRRKLKSSQEQAKLLSLLTFEGILIHKNMKIISTNEAFVKMLGYDCVEDLVNKNVLDIIADQSKNKALNNIKGSKAEAYMLYMLRKDGSSVPCEATVKNLVYNGEEVRVASIRDISKLEEGENLYDTTINAMTDWIHVIDRDYKLILINNSMKETNKKLGLPFLNTQLVGKTYHEIYSFLSRNVLEEYEKVFKTGKEIITHDTICIDGKYFYTETKKTPIFTSGEVTKVLTTIRDISNQKQAEREKEDMQKQIFLASKLASIGELSAGVAHEINNPLAIIQGYMEIVENSSKMKLIIDPQIISKIKKSIARISAIVNSMRSYSRTNYEKDEIIDLKKVIQDTVSLVRSIYAKENIFIDEHYEAVNHHIRGNTGKLQQILMNLFSNAKDALEGMKNAKISIHTSNDKEKLVIRISDNGKGIDKESIDRIFDPFFTTKPPGKGTGLGLGIVHSILKSLGGEISFDSTYGIGTEIKINFPNIIEKGNYSTVRQAKTIKSKILLIDKNSDLRELLEEHLRYIGAEVDTAESTYHARSKINQSTYDFIITNIEIPERNCKYVVEELKEMKGLRAKVLVTVDGVLSSYNSKQRKLIDACVDGCIKKPFSLDDIYTELKRLKNGGPKRNRTSSWGLGNPRFIR